MGDPSSIKSANFEIVIKKCTDETMNDDGTKTVCKRECDKNTLNDDGTKMDCKSGDPLKNFINDIEVDTW